MIKTEYFLSMADRYIFDYGECSVKNGFAQIDSDQDAWYHGIWASPQKRTILSYCEGDVTKRVCETDEEFKTEFEELIKWLVDSEHFVGVDCMCQQTIIDEFTALGLGHLLH